MMTVDGMGPGPEMEQSWKLSRLMTAGEHV